MFKKKVFLIHGPNFNILELREKGSYGGLTLRQIEDEVRVRLAKSEIDVVAFQSNSEGEILECIHKAIQSGAGGMIINAAAYSHTSIALLDALTCFRGPIIEVHLSNIFKREKYRHHSFVSSVASGVICGLGLYGYVAAVDSLVSLIEPKSDRPPDLA